MFFVTLRKSLLAGHCTVFKVLSSKMHQYKGRTKDQIWSMCMGYCSAHLSCILFCSLLLCMSKCNFHHRRISVCHQTVYTMNDQSTELTDVNKYRVIDTMFNLCTCLLEQNVVRYFIQKIELANAVFINNKHLF